MENDDANANIMIMRKLIIRAIEEINDTEFLDFIYQLIEYHHKEQCVHIYARKDLLFMQGQNEELKEVKDKVIEAVEKIDDPDVLKLILNIFELRKKRKTKKAELDQLCLFDCSFCQK